MIAQGALRLRLYELHPDVEPLATGPGQFLAGPLEVLRLDHKSTIEPGADSRSLSAPSW